MDYTDRNGKPVDLKKRAQEHIKKLKEEENKSESKKTKETK
ncbi:hypothetical protein [Konateibacter massiliensis]|nr:hypothetical protein [Konateibacter massiliensis]